MVRSALAALAAIVDTERTSARVDSGQAARPAAVLTNTDDRGSPIAGRIHPLER